MWPWSKDRLVRRVDKVVVRSVTNVSNVSYILSTHGQTNLTALKRPNLVVVGKLEAEVWAQSDRSEMVSLLGLAGPCLA